jgi:methyltransferase (TIGR00027 family)
MTEVTSKPARTAGRRQRPSHTAAKVARGVLYLSGDPLYARLLPEGAAESIERLSLAAGVVKPWMLRLFERSWYRRLIGWVVDKIGPGELMRLTLRKRFVDDELRAAIGAGAGQVLVVGAGFDTVGLRIAEAYPEVMVVEVDTAATVDRKRGALENIGGHRGDYHLFAADLARSSLGQVLNAVPTWREDAQSVVVAEGVMMYLDEVEVAGFLHEIQKCTGPRSRLIFSYVAADDRGRPYLGVLSGLIRVSLKLVGEPLRWAVRAGELESFLQRSGFRLAEPPARFDLQKRYLAPLGIDQTVGQIERFAVAEIIESPRLTVLEEDKEG